MNSFPLSKSILFRGTDENEIHSMLKCLGAYKRLYKKGEAVYHAGDVVECMGMVLYGSVDIESDDICGNRSLLSHVEPGNIFAETYACIPGAVMLVNVIAAEETEVLFMNTARLLRTCSNSCEHHKKLVQNLLEISARKNLHLSQRILHTSSKSIRGRLLSYFSEQAVRAGNCEFTIPLNRQQLADYLNVDRSALCNELSKMQKDGLLTYRKNVFCLRETAGVFS